MNNIGPTLITVLGGIFTLAMVAVIVAQKAQTSQVLQGAGSALTSVIQAAVQPVVSSGTGFGGSGG